MKRWWDDFVIKEIAAGIYPLDPTSLKLDSVFFSSFFFGSSFFVFLFLIWQETVCWQEHDEKKTMRKTRKTRAIHFSEPVILGLGSKLCVGNKNSAAIYLGGGFTYFYFYPEPWGNDPF